MPLYKFNVDGQTYKCHADKPLQAVKKVIAQRYGANHRFYICRKEIYNPSGKSIANRYIFITGDTNNLKKWLSDQFRLLNTEKIKNGWDQWGEKEDHLTQKDILETVLATYEPSGIAVVSKDSLYYKHIYDLHIKAYLSD